MLTLDARRDEEVGLTYRQWNIDDQKEEPVKSWSSYDGVPRVSHLLPAHDFSFECDVEVQSASRRPSFACRLFDADAVSAEITVGPRRGGDGHAEPR